jgi:hypothetical protein
MKNVLFTLCFVIMILFMPVISCAQDDEIELEINMICPEFVRVGDSLTIALEITNLPDSTGPAIITKSAIVGFFPHGEILGPYTVPISKTINPGETVTIPNYITYSMPSVVPSKTVVGHGVTLCGSSFSDCYEATSCVVEVMP